MLRPFGSGLPSDSITHRYGFDGHEADTSDAYYLANAAFGVRSTFVVNTFYKEIRGGHYNNRALYSLINRALNSVGILVVNREYWQESGLVPVEGDGHLYELERYVLAEQPQSQIGVMELWAFHAGGGGSYYGDDTVFDIILPEKRTRRLVDEVEALCHAAAVKFTRAPAGSPTPIKPPTGVWNWIRRRLH